MGPGTQRESYVLNLCVRARWPLFSVWVFFTSHVHDVNTMPPSSCSPVVYVCVCIRFRLLLLRESLSEQNIRHHVLYRTVNRNQSLISTPQHTHTHTSRRISSEHHRRVRVKTARASALCVCSLLALTHSPRSSVANSFQIIMPDFIKKIC